MKIFCTGASGYIGGSVAAKLVAIGLSRSETADEMIKKIGATPLRGSLDDRDILQAAARDADMVVNSAHADHVGAAEALLEALAGSGKKFVHTSGSSLVGQRSQGKLSDEIFDEDTPVSPSPARVARVTLNKLILASADNGVHPIIICPSLIYGLGLGADPHSMQVPWMIELARKYGVGKHIGAGTNVWSNVHMSDLVDLYLLAIEKAPAGGFYYAENGEMSMKELAESIGRMLEFGGKAETISMANAEVEWGEGPANDTMASNSRVRGVKGRALGWAPSAPSLLEEIENGCYVGVGG
ncbi:MAG: NAD-dependent epimerase/dehydratase family protein [Rhizobiaceae bacterium]|nr:NAD-dependent epimerase/dehydratase family protein [Rhizobiaceae bacterium]